MLKSCFKKLNLFVFLIDLPYCLFFVLIYVFLLCISSPQERQRLETILSLCSELGQADRDGGGATVADLQKINQELEKLQVNDEDDDEDDSVLPVFLDSPSAGGTNGHAPSAGLENGYCGDIRLTSRRPSETSLASLRGFAPSPSPRLLRNAEARNISVRSSLQGKGAFALSSFTESKRGECQNAHPSHTSAGRYLQPVY